MLRRLFSYSVLLWSAASAWAADQPARLRPVPKVDLNMQTGPAVGSRIPDFTAVDQSGKPRNFASLRGPKGLVLLFARSADW